MLTRDDVSILTRWLEVVGHIKVLWKKTTEKNLNLFQIATFQRFVNCLCLLCGVAVRIVTGRPPRSLDFPSAGQAARGLRPRRRRGRLASFFRRYLVLKDNAEQLASQAVGEPRVFDDRHLEALAAEPGIVVGVDGPTHSLDDHQVGLTLPHHHRQHFV